MTLKAGDLCFIVNSEAGNNGKVIQLVKPLGIFNLLSWNDDVGKHVMFWEIVPSLPDFTGEWGNDCPVTQLKKIDNPGDDVVDESFAWLPPVPQLEEIEA